MYRIQYLFHQVFIRLKYEKRRYLLYIFSFYTGLLLPAFCIANIRSADQVIYYTTFEGMKNAAQINWLGESFDAAKSDDIKQCSVSAYYEEDFSEWKHQYVAVNGIDEYYFYPLPKITGRVFAEREFKNGENVCLLSRKYAEQYSYDIGDLLSIRGKQFEITGYTEDEKYLGITIPYNAMKKVYRGENLIQFSCIFLEENEVDREETAKALVRQIKGIDENAEILEVVAGESLYEDAIVTKTKWRFVRGAAVVVSLLFFVLNEIIVLAGKIQKERRVIGVNMALGASEKEVKLCLFFETLIITLTAAVLVLITLLPLAEISGLRSEVVLDWEAVTVISVMALVVCELLTWGAFGTARKDSISVMLKRGDL